MEILLSCIDILHLLPLLCRPSGPLIWLAKVHSFERISFYCLWSSRHNSNYTYKDAIGHPILGLVLYLSLGFGRRVVHLWSSNLHLQLPWKIPSQKVWLFRKFYSLISIGVISQYISFLYYHCSVGPLFSEHCLFPLALTILLSSGCH